jgi:predicted amidophosphoribosyltransferase
VIRLTKIDDTSIGDHYHLKPADQCYFLYEYTSGKGYGYKDNGVISNLKKSPLRPSTELKWKEAEIRKCAQKFKVSLSPAWLSGSVLVPIPGSKTSDHPEYDDRMLRLCRQIGTSHQTIELVRQCQSTEAAHLQTSGDRISLQELLEIYEFVEPNSSLYPVKIAIVDDVLTAGTHYRAMHTILAEKYPDAEIIGLFVARRILPTDSFFSALS